MMIRNAKCLAAGLVLSCSVAAWAQEVPKAEVLLDYSYARYAPSASYTNGHSLNGGGGRVAFNVNHWLGLAADFQGYNSNTSNFVIPVSTRFPSGAQASVSGNLFTYMFGPILNFRTHRVQAFGDLLFGAAHSNVYGNAFKTICQPSVGPSPCSVSGSPSGNAYAMSVGGGIDIPLNQRISFRVGEFDYLYTRFTNQFTNAGQNNFRYLAGININVGTPTPQPNH